MPCIHTCIMLYKSQVTVKLCTFGELSFPVSHTVNRCRHALDQLIAYQYNRSVIEYNSVVEEKYHQYSCSTGTKFQSWTRNLVGLTVVYAGVPMLVLIHHICKTQWCLCIFIIMIKHKMKTENFNTARILL